MALFSGLDSKGEPEFIHAVSHKKNGNGERGDAVKTWSLSRFANSSRYNIFHGVRRVIDGVKNFSEADEDWYYKNFKRL